MRKRFVINVDGKTKTVFKALEIKSNYDLNIHIAKGGRMEETVLWRGFWRRGRVHNAFI